MTRRVAYEGSDHKAYKRIAIDILKERGFTSSEIEEEHTVEYRMNGRLNYVIDMVGIKEGYKVAVECGDNDPSKLMNLRKLFDEVLVVNPQKVVELYEYWKGRHHTDVTALQHENIRLKERAEWVCDNANSKIDPLMDEIESLKKEKEALKVKLRKYEKVMAKAWENVKEQS